MRFWQQIGVALAVGLGLAGVAYSMSYVQPLVCAWDREQSKRTCDLLDGATMTVFVLALLVLIYLVLCRACGRLSFAFLLAFQDRHPSIRRSVSYIRTDPFFAWYAGASDLQEQK